MRGVQLCISAGAPDWLNLVVLVLAWDAIKLSTLALVTAFRWGACITRRRVTLARSANPHETSIILH